MTITYGGTFPAHHTAWSRIRATTDEESGVVLLRFGSPSLYFVPNYFYYLHETIYLYDYCTCTRQSDLDGG